MKIKTESLIQRIRELSTELIPEPTGMKPQLEYLGKVRAVFLDVYGTLFVSGCGDISTAETIHNQGALAAALKSCECTGDLRQAAKRGAVLFEKQIKKEHALLKKDGVEYPEVDVREIWEAVLKKLVVEQLLDKQLGYEKIEQLAVEFECRVNPVWPMPGLKEFLHEIKARNIPCGIVSNAQFFTPLLFDALLNCPLEQCGIDSRLCSWSYTQRCSKPASSLFEKSLKQLKSIYGVSAAETVYVGNDCLNDVAGAQSAGCKGVLFAGDERSLRLRQNDPRCRNVKPNAIITELNQLLALLDKKTA